MASGRQDKGKPPVLDNNLGPDLYGKPVQVRTPQIYCCNCGTRNWLSTIDTAFFEPYTLTNYFRKRRALHLALPYCEPCSVRAGKHPTSRLVKQLLWFVLWLFAFGFAAGMLSGADASPFVTIVVLLALTIGIVGLAWFFEQPRAPMTARYQSVKILEYNGHPKEMRVDDMTVVPAISAVAVLVAKLWHGARGTKMNGIDQLTFAFTNRTYGKAFGMVNAEAFERGILKYSRRSKR